MAGGAEACRIMEHRQAGLAEGGRDLEDKGTQAGRCGRGGRGMKDKGTQAGRCGRGGRGMKDRNALRIRCAVKHRCMQKKLCETDA